MGTVLLSILGVALIGWAFFGFLFRKTDDRAFNVGFAVLIATAFIGLFGGMVASASIGHGLPQDQVVTEHHALGSVSQATNIEGSFIGLYYIASGHIDSVDVVNYWVQADNGGYQHETIKANDPNLYVFEEDRSDAEIDTVEYRFQDPNNGIWFTTKPAETRIYVPKGTITTCNSLAQAGSSACQS